MRNALVLFWLICISFSPLYAQSTEPVSENQIPISLPDSIVSGPFQTGHIQGFAIDSRHQYVYYSYTTMLVKSDMQGRVIGTVKGLLGHLGCLDFNEADGRIYGSLEYKNDAIGKGILQMEQSDQTLDNAFYIAIFDVEKINRMDMDAERDGIMTTVYLPTVLDDYLAHVSIGTENKEHRFGCSGIDGVSFGPRFGKLDGKQYLTVAYGIYGETDRSDNDYQVLLQYDITKWKAYEHPLSQEQLHRQGPRKPNGRYFVWTGNTTYGVQNLEYDAHSHTWYLAVYKGQKTKYPNYSLFAIDGTSRPVSQPLLGIPYLKRGKVIPLKQDGLQDPLTGIRGWHFPYGSTGICAIGDGQFYISENYHTSQGQGAVLRLYRHFPQE